jgi:hypothetical protein
MESHFTWRALCLYYWMSMSTGVETELNAYTRIQQVPLDTDPLIWWKQHVQDFPRLVRMTRQYLAVPASSVSPERLFSSVGLLKSYFQVTFWTLP